MRNIGFLLSTLLTVTFAAGCQPKSDAAPSEGKEKSAEAASVKAETKEKAAEPKAADKEAKPKASGERGALANQPHVKVEKAEPLTEAEKALIAADPNQLTREERIKRGYALRKKIMQNPDSPAAQSLLQTAESIRNGEIPIPEHLKTPTGTEMKADAAAPEPKKQ